MKPDSLVYNVKANKLEKMFSEVVVDAVGNDNFDLKIGVDGQDGSVRTKIETTPENERKFHENLCSTQEEYEMTNILLADYFNKDELEVSVYAMHDYYSGYSKENILQIFVDATPRSNEIKLFEVRDIATTMSCMAIKPANLSDKERFIFGRIGYKPAENYVFMGIIGEELITDPYAHDDTRTLREAHKYIKKNWEELESGEVIDVEFILGETDTKKESEYNA